MVKFFIKPTRFKTNRGEKAQELICKQTDNMIIDKDFSKKLALKLLKINAVILRPDEPFRWSSGWYSPIYCDNRLTMRYPKLRAEIAEYITGYIKNKYATADVITGTATAGIPHAAWVAERLDKPMVYVRGKAKTHGTTSQIEGRINKGESSVVIEDLISTGESAISAAKVLEFVGAEVLGIISIFTYGFDHAKEKFEQNGLELATLTDYETLITIALENGFVKEENLELLNQWRMTPETWPD